MICFRMVGKKRSNPDEGNSNITRKDPKGVGEEAAKGDVIAIQKLISEHESSSKRGAEMSSDSDNKDSRFKSRRKNDYRTPVKKDARVDFVKKPKKEERRPNPRDATDDDEYESLDEGHKRSKALLDKEKNGKSYSSGIAVKKGSLKQKTIEIALNLGIKNKELRSENQELMKKLQVKSEKTEVKPAEVQKLGDDNARLRKKREELEKEIDSNKSTLRRVRKEREEAKDEVEKGKKEVSNLVQEVRNLRKQHNEECFSQEEKYLLEMRIDELEEEKKALEEGKAEGDCVANLQDEIDDLEKKKVSLIREFEELDAEKIKLQLEVEELRENGQEKVDDSSEVLELKDKISRITKKAMKDKNLLEEGNKELRSTLEGLKAKLILTQKDAKKGLEEFGIEVTSEVFYAEGVESQSLFGDSRAASEDEDNKSQDDEEGNENQAKSVLVETASFEDISTDDELDSRAATFMVGDYKVRNVKTFKDSMVRSSKLPAVVAEASKRFRACTLNNKIMFIVLNSNSRGEHVPKPKMGASFCNLAPVCSRKFSEGDTIAMVYVFGCVFHSANMTEVWVCGHHADCSVEGYEMQIQTRNRDSMRPAVKGVKAVEKDVEGGEKTEGGTKDGKSSQEKINKK